MRNSAALALRASLESPDTLETTYVVLDSCRNDPDLNRQRAIVTLTDSAAPIEDWREKLAQLVSQIPTHPVAEAVREKLDQAQSFMNEVP